jgi:hypothetical protein
MSQIKSIFKKVDINTELTIADILQYGYPDSSCKIK